MPYLRHRSFVFAPASPSFNTPMICSSVNRLDFIVRSHLGGLYSVTVLFAGSTSSLPIEGSVGPVVIVVVLPFAKLVIEQMDIVGDAVFVQQLVELLLVHSV